MPERHPFTESEDRHLVQFIAVNNPEISGRNGNKLYKMLVDNPNRWPWSKSHPWQSWRERYKMNAGRFDRKIKRYLREQQAAREAASAGPSDKVSNEAEGSNQVEGRTVKRKGPSIGAGTDAERKRTAPLNQQTSTTVDSGTPIGDSVKVSKDTGNASTDSGYASTTKKTSHESEKKQSGSHTPERLHKTATKEQSCDNATSSSRPPLIAYPGQAVSASGPEKATVSQTEGAPEEEEEQSTTKECSGEDHYMHELFGSSTEDEDEDVAEPEDPPASSAPSSPSTEQIYPSLRNTPPDIAKKDHDSFGVARPAPPPQVPTPQKSRLPSSPPPSPLVRRSAGVLRGEKRQLKRKAPEDDPFIDDTPPTPSPIPKQHLAARKAPPVLNEGPYRNVYVQTRNPNENQVWPPNRKRTENGGPSQITGSHAPTRSRIGGKTRQQVNAVASSSKVKLPPSTTLRPDDPFLIGSASQKSTQQPVPMTGAVLSKTQTTPVGTETTERIRADVTEQPPSKRQKFGHPPVTHEESPHSTLAPISTSSPVISVSNNFRGNPRPDTERPATLRIDLRESLKKRCVRSEKSSLLSSRGSTASISNYPNRRNSAASGSRHRRQRVSDNDNESLISLFERDLAGLGEQYGFALGIVKQLYMQFGTLEKTILALRALNSIMQGAQNKLYEEMQRLGSTKDEDTDDGDSIPEGIIPKNVSSRGKERRKERREEESATPPNKRHRPSLNYKPLITDVEDQSEYSPPSRTRAGRYTKLQKEGREEEALIAASGGRITKPMRNYSRGDVNRTTIKRGMEPSSPSVPDHECSPTPDAGEVMVLRGTGGEGHDEKGDGDIELAVDISPDRYEMRQPTPEVEHEELVSKEEQKLCFEVTLGNRGILTAFEKRQDGPWRSKRNWFEDRFSALKEVQEVRRQEFYRTEDKAEEWDV